MLKINEIKNSIIRGDSIKILKRIPSNSIDLIFSDPPYFMQTSGNLFRYGGDVFKGVNDKWDKFASYKDYDNFTKEWLTECKRILKTNGSLWVIGTYHNLFRLGYIMQNLNFWILNDIIWHKSNPTPNFLGTKFVNSQETLIWATKSKESKYIFNYKTMKILNNGKQMGSVWKIPISSGKERLKDKYGLKLHNTQKPEKLLELIILAASKEGDIILDPFFGTGTTGVVSKKFLRNYIGIEKETKYINAAELRIKKIMSKPNDFTKATFDIKPPSVPIQQLIEENWISKKFLYDKFGKNKTSLLKTGKVKIEDIEYSIHLGAAKLNNKINQNGWEYWFIKNNNSYISINEIRKEYRKKILKFNG